jgi:agmatinase
MTGEPQWRTRRDTTGDPSREPGPLDLTRYRLERPNQNPAQTFLKLPLAMTEADLRAGEVDVAICGVPFEMVMSAGGMSYGPQAIRGAEYLPVPPLEKPNLAVGVDPFEVLRVVDYGDAGVTPFDIAASHDSIQGFVGEIVGAGAVPIALGGDHSITRPVVSALAERHGAGTIGLVHFDAHADTAPDSYGSPIGQGSPIRRLVEDGVVAGHNVVQIGLRGYWPGADVLAWMAEHGIRMHTMAAIDHFGFARVLDRAIDEALAGAEHVYISLDVDVLDPSAAPGTGGLEPGGLTARELLPAVRRVAAEVGICGMDVVEVSPLLDSRNRITAIVAHRAVLEALTGMAMRRLGLTARSYASETALGSPPTAGRPRVEDH